MRKKKEETRKCVICGETKPASKFTTKEICALCYHRRRRLKEKMEKDLSDSSDDDVKIRIATTSTGEGVVVLPIEKYLELINNQKKNQQ